MQIHDKVAVSQARLPNLIGRRVRVEGWVRTRRDSKGGFSFLEINDGSCLGNLQVIAPSNLTNYETVVKHLHTGASVVVHGEIKASPGKGQVTELLASQIEIYGDAHPESYPLQKKNHSFEFLRTIAHLRPRTNTFGAVTRLRSHVS
ncbi:MAG: OB-fold nucleic acid binding domain-containing protein, partial [Candidatus Bilamarchaeaceae archaeon]